MSGIAELLLNLGFNVSGSDINENDNVKRLKNLNIDEITPIEALRILNDIKTKYNSQPFFDF